MSVTVLLLPLHTYNDSGIVAMRSFDAEFNGRYNKIE